MKAQNVTASLRERAVAAIASGAIVLGFVVMLVVGLRVGWQPANVPPLLSVDVTRQPPPPPTEKSKPLHSIQPAPKKAAAPRALKAEATPVVAPPIIPLIVFPPVVVATRAGTGAASSQGASNLAGPGQGAGGIGNGTGGGGLGGDGGGVPEVGPRQIRGRLSYKDLPDGLLGEGQRASVGVRYTINVDGSVSNCIADRPSAYPTLNAMTCQLITQRFVYRPAKDRDGRPVRSVIVETHTWFSDESGN